MALVAQLITDVRQKVRPCPGAVIQRAYVRAARDFCGQSRWYQADYNLTLQANVRAYAIAPPVASGFADTQLEVVDLTWQGHWINSSLTGALSWTPLGKADPSAFNPNVAPDMPTRVAYSPEGTVEFDAVPDQAYPVMLKVVYQPIEAATDIPDALLVKWREQIEAGALEYLYSLEGEPFANGKLAAASGAVYRAGINNAKANVAQAFQSGSRRALPRPFGAFGGVGIFRR